MIYFSKYAEQKFDILHKYQVYITREQVEDAVKLPDKAGKKGNYRYARKDKLGVIYYELPDKSLKIATFYPIK